MEPRLQLPGVGRGLQDHPNVGLQFIYKPAEGEGLERMLDKGNTSATAFVQSPIALRNEAVDGHPRGCDVQLLCNCRQPASLCPSHSLRSRRPASCPTTL